MFVQSSAGISDVGGLRALREYGGLRSCFLHSTSLSNFLLVIAESPHFLVDGEVASSA